MNGCRKSDSLFLLFNMKEISNIEHSISNDKPKIYMEIDNWELIIYSTGKQISHRQIPAQCLQAHR